MDNREADSLRVIQVAHEETPKMETTLEQDVEAPSSHSTSRRDSDLLDDVLIYSSDQIHHFERLQMTFETLGNANLRLNPRSASFSNDNRLPATPSKLATPPLIQQKWKWLNRAR